MRYVDSLRLALSSVLEHATQRGDLTTPQNNVGGHTIAVSAAIALLVHWGTIHDRPITDDDIKNIVDGVLMPLLSRP